MIAYNIILFGITPSDAMIIIILKPVYKICCSLYIIILLELSFTGARLGIMPNSLVNVPVFVYLLV